MNHPEEWMAYLYQELPPTKKIELETHLGECEECRHKVHSLRRTMLALDSWAIPSMPRAQSSGQGLKWAIAASLILGFGILVGISMRPVQVNAQLSEALRKEVKTQMSLEYQAALAGTRQELTNTVHSQLRASIEQMAEASSFAASAALEKQIKLLLDEFKELKTEENTSTVDLLNRLENQFNLEITRLRRDLETVAVLAENKINQTQQQLGDIALAAGSSPTHPSPK